MSKQSRIEIIKKIQQKRDSFLISYATSTRPNLEVQMAMDSIRKIYEHILLFKKKPEELKIDLFLYSNGGDGIVPWRVVTLIRECATKFCTLIPYKAFSAATLTALGADEIVMHPMGVLGPTDPTVANEFNPPNPQNKDKKLGISVEDVTAYINLIREDAGITHEDELVQAFNKLPEQVHPLALGNVKRSLSQSRMMAKKLLALHMDEGNDFHQINEIVDNLTSKLYYHGHPINRQEASKDVGIKTVTIPDNDVEKLMWDLFLEYETELKLEEPFTPLFEFIKSNPNIPPNQPNQLPILKQVDKLAFIESENKTDFVEFDYEIVGGKNQQNGSYNIQINTTFQGWKTE